MKNKAIILTAICSFFTSVGFSQTTPIPEPGAPSTPIKSGVGVPMPVEPIPYLELIRESQSAMLAAIFCGTPDNQLWMLELDAQPAVGDDVEYTDATNGSATWTTLFIHEYDWFDGLADGSISQDQFMELLNNSMRADLIAGTLDGPCSAATMISISLSWIEQGEEHYMLIPIFEVPQSVFLIFEDIPEGFSNGRTIESDCEVCEWGCCFEIYRGRMQDALNGYFGDLKRLVPPVGIGATACFTLCAPFATIPPSYLACAASCNAGVAAGAVINANTASNEVEFARESAKISYCLCLDWKERNCNDSEPDLVGCD